MSVDPAVTKLMMQAALCHLSAGRFIARGLGVALVCAGIAVANPAGMAQSSADWQQLANEIEVVKKGIQNVQIGTKDGWIADDREAFVAATDRYLAELEDVKTYFANAAKSLDAVAAIYYALWVALAALACQVFIVVLTLSALRLVPHLGAWAAAMIEMIAAFAARAVDRMVKSAGAVLTSVGAATAAGVLSGLFEVGVPGRTGGATGREDFKEITLDYRPPTVYLAPIKELPETPTP